MSILHPSAEFLYGIDPAALIAFRLERRHKFQPQVLRILSRFSGGRRFEDVLPTLGDWFEDEETARAFLTKMRDAELLTSDEPQPEPGAVALEPSSSSHLPERLVVRSGLLLRVRREGFVAHDPNRRRDVILPEEALAALHVFAEPHQTSELEGEELAWAAALSATRMLMLPPEQAARTKEPAQPKPRSRPHQSDRERIPIYGLQTHTSSSDSHVPLSLGMLAAYARAHDGGALLSHYELRPFRTKGEHLLEDLRENGPGIVLFSDYIWCEREHREISRRAKAMSPSSVIVHGGPSVPKYDEAFAQYMRANSHIDVAIHGEGEVTASEAWSAMAPPLMEMRRAFLGGATPAPIELGALSSVAGLAFRSSSAAAGFVRTEERERASDLDRFPSPYLTGEFDGEPGEWFGAIIESNRGCPYGCTFCDWGSAILQKIKKFSLDRVFSEIEWVARNQIRVLYIADANFGIFDRDIEVARHIAEMKQRYGFPLDVKMSYAKNATANLTEIVRIFTRVNLASEGVISIQTTDPETLVAIRRSNIKTSKYDELADTFRENQLPLATDLMYGLPGSTLASFKRDLQMYLDRDIPAAPYATVMLPNAPMADPEYRALHQIKTRKIDEQEHIVATSTFTESDWEEMYILSGAFHTLVNMGVLRHVLLFLQWEYEIAAIDLVHRLASACARGDRRLLHTGRMLRSLRSNASAPGAWWWMYREVAEVAKAELGVRDDLALETVLRVQEAVMPEDGLIYPRTIELSHDYAAYFEENIRHGSGKRIGRRLAEHPPGVLDVSDPLGLARLDRRALNFFYFQSVTLELRSQVSRRVASMRRMMR